MKNIDLSVNSIIFAAVCQYKITDYFLEISSENFSMRQYWSVSGKFEIVSKKKKIVKFDIEALLWTETYEECHRVMKECTRTVLQLSCYTSLKRFPVHFYLCDQVLNILCNGPVIPIKTNILLC